MARQPTAEDSRPLERGLAMTEKQKQHARQFLGASVFKTYDAILALVKHIEKDRKKKGTWKAGEPLIFTGSTQRLAEKNSTCRHTESRHIDRLVKEGWLVQIAGQWRDGGFGTKHYHVVTVEEWLTTHVFIQKSRKKSDALRKTNARRHLKRLGIDAEPFVDAYLHPSKRAAVEQDMSVAVEQDMSPAVAQDMSTAVAQDCARMSVGLPVKTSPHTQAQSASVREDASQNTFDQVAKYLSVEMLTSQWKNGEQEQVDELIRTHGWKKFYAVQYLYWQEQNPVMFSNTHFRWTALIKGFSGLLGKVTTEMLQEQDTDRFRKEHPEEWERIQQESMDRQTEELVRIKFTNNTPKKPIAEISMEDFLNQV
jgi:hypothetical protein